VRYGGTISDGIEALSSTTWRVPDMLNAATGAEPSIAREVPGHRDDRSARKCRAWSDLIRRRTFLEHRGTGLATPDLPVFVAIGETTCCIGDMFALVVADTMFHAREAAKKVKIEYQVWSL